MGNNGDTEDYEIEDEKLLKLIDKYSKSYETQAYIPKVRKIQFDDETGLEEKFGGRLPFLLKSEKWPIDSNGVPMEFIFQFCDPRTTNNNILYRFFLPFEDNNKTPSIDNNARLLSVKITNIVVKNQNKNIKPPPNTVIYDPYEITDWEMKTELASWSTFYKISEINKYVKKQYKRKKQELFFMYNFEIYEKNKQYEHLYNVIKVGGTPRSTQLEEYVQDMDFVQLSKTYYQPISWGDAGIAHIGKDGKYHWDCH